MLLAVGAVQIRIDAVGGDVVDVGTHNCARRRAYRSPSALMRRGAPVSIYLSSAARRKGKAICASTVRILMGISRCGELSNVGRRAVVRADRLFWLVSRGPHGNVPRPIDSGRWPVQASGVGSDVQWSAAAAWLISISPGSPSPTSRSYRRGFGRHRHRNPYAPLDRCRRDPIHSRQTAVWRESLHVAKLVPLGCE
jgi:hypothetical protein